MSLLYSSSDRACFMGNPVPTTKRLFRAAFFVTLHKEIAFLRALEFIYIHIAHIRLLYLGYKRPLISQLCNLLNSKKNSFKINADLSWGDISRHLPSLLPSHNHLLTTSIPSHLQHTVTHNISNQVTFVC